MSNLNTNPFLNRPGNNQPAVPRESTAPFTTSTPGSTPAPSPMEPQIPMDNTPYVAGDSPRKTASPFEVPVGPTAAPYGLQAEPPQVQEEAVTAEADGGHPLGLPYYGCPMGDAVIRFFRNYAKFSGRASRSEFWWVVLATVIASTIFGMLATGFPGIMGIFAILFIVFELSLIVPSLALMTRRAHDSNMSGWWVFGYCAASALSCSLAVTAFIQALTPLKMVVIENSDCVTTLNQTSINSGATRMMMGVSSLLSLVTFVLFLVITLRKPRPEGVRFDKQYIPTPPTDLGSNGGTKTAGDTDSFSNILD